MRYKGDRKECRYKDTSGKKPDAANPQTTGELPFPHKHGRSSVTRKRPAGQDGAFSRLGPLRPKLVDQPTDRVELRLRKSAVPQPVRARGLDVISDLLAVEAAKEGTQEQTSADG